MTLASPIWLFGLLLLPAIRWLHRGGRHRRTIQVSRLDLWRGLAASSPAVGERRPPDPAWQRRALLAALLCFALTEPQLPEQGVRVTLWIDDSLSMFTREAQGTRLALGLARARAQLSELAHVDIEVRKLSDPWHGHGVLSEATIADLVAGAAGKESSAPPAALLHHNRQHWLVTDGADAAVLQWPGSRHPDHIIQVAGVTRNVGLDRLSARRNLNDADKIDLLLKVTNGGMAPETREVSFITDAGKIIRAIQRLDPGASVLVDASIPISDKVRVKLQPSDALAEDDEIVLDLGPLRRRRVAVDPSCPRALVAAVEAHPALSRAQHGTDNVQAVLDCSSRSSRNEVATIRVLASKMPVRPSGSVQWSSNIPESRRIRFDAERLRLSDRLSAGPADSVLLAAGDEPVIVSRGGAAKLIETSLDFGSAGAPDSPDLPLLLNLMFDRLFDSRLLDEIAIIDRGPGSTRVAPWVTVAAKTGAPVPVTSRTLGDWTRLFLVAAVLVLLWEIAALGRQWHRLSR